MLENDQLKSLSLSDLQEAMTTIGEKQVRAWTLADTAIAARNSDLIYSMAIDIKALEQVQQQIADAIKEKTV